ncbi:hypothetical protein L345_06284, partial [Ophiophagus hannah]
MRRLILQISSFIDPQLSSSLMRVNARDQRTATPALFLSHFGRDDSLRFHSAARL